MAVLESNAEFYLQNVAYSVLSYTLGIWEGVELGEKQKRGVFKVLYGPCVPRTGLSARDLVLAFC